MSHGDRVEALPPGFRVVAASEGAPFAAIADDSRRFYGVQFHPEVVHTPHGAALLRNFTHTRRRLPRRLDAWRRSAREAVARIRRQVGDGPGHLRPVGRRRFRRSRRRCCTRRSATQLTCIFVDTGLLRAGEADEVVRLFRDHYNIPLVHRDAGELFLGKLAGVTDPEQKRKIIGATFIDVFDEEARRSAAPISWRRARSIPT